MSVELRHISKTYGGSRPAVDDVSFLVESGEFFTLLGPSGCGKTTTLRMIAGLEAPITGDILFDGRVVTRVHPRDRGVGLVFQSYALYPHMSVFDNLALNLKVQRLPRAEIERRVRATASMLQLEHLLSRRPARLSGGERQRVALGRAIIRNPRVLLMDEPLSNLDLKLREQMRTELKRLHGEYRHTVIYVTHDQIEAMTLADRIAVMRSGVIQQIGTPEEIYSAPRNVFVASFIGSPTINLLPGQIERANDGVYLRLGRASEERIPLSKYRPVDGALIEGNRHFSVLVGARPEDVVISASKELGGFPLHISMIQPAGATTYLVLRTIGSATDSPVQMIAAVGVNEKYSLSSQIFASFRFGNLLLYDSTSQALVARA